MKNKFLKHQGNYYAQLNALMTQLSIRLEAQDEACRSSTPPETKCKICNQNTSKYTCPKCKILYCSINCYNQHSQTCTEEFFKENVVEELKSTKVNEADAKKFRNRLKDFYSKLDQDSEKTLDFTYVDKNKIQHYEKILDKLDNNTFDFKEDLTPDDWEDFQKFLRSNLNPEDKFGKLYTPFWEREPYSINLIDKEKLNNFTKEDLDTLKDLAINQYKGDNEIKEEEEEEEKDFFDVIDEDEKNLQYIKLGGKNEPLSYDIINISMYLKYQSTKDLSSMTSVPPSEKNIYQVVLFLLTTEYVFRLFNGDFTCPEDITSDVLEYILSICPLLHAKVEKRDVPYDVQSSFNSFFSNIRIIEGKYLAKTENLLITDLLKILEGGKCFIFESLIRLYEIIHVYSTQNKLKKEPKKQCINSKHKLVYFLSYIKSNLSNNEIDNLKQKIFNYKKDIFIH